jgi:hypothetical protein
MEKEGGVTVAPCSGPPEPGHPRLGPTSHSVFTTSVRRTPALIRTATRISPNLCQAWPGLGSSAGLPDPSHELASTLPNIADSEVLNEVSQMLF